MSNILVNGLQSKTGGGKSILNNYLTLLRNGNSPHRFFVLTPDKREYERYSCEFIRTVEIARAFRSNLLFPLMYLVALPRLMRAHKIDIIFNLGDIPIPSHIPQVYLFDWSYAVYPDNVVAALKPDVISVSGWMDVGYLIAARPQLKKGVPVVTMFDDIWWKTWKQRIASLLFPFIKRQLFSHAWVAGPYQYEYAKRLGFLNNEIIFNCLSADLTLFNKSYSITIKGKMVNYPHRFLYAGRLESIKGIRILIEAWQKIKKNRGDWELVIVGNGSLHKLVCSQKDIILHEFMQPADLISVVADVGCYILPSLSEPWALVLHEFSAAGLPIICSDVCGAAPMFVIPNYNGFVCKYSDVTELSKRMLNIINMPDEALLKMAQNSHRLGQRITPEISAASFVSLLG